MRKLIRYLLISIPLILVLAAGGFVVWANIVPTPMSETLAAMQNDSQVEFSRNNNDWLVFTPKHQVPTVGLIFYPGGRVTAEAYAPAMHEIAEQGYLAVVVPMPLNLAFFGVDRGTDVIASFPEIDDWVIAGHSLGGAMAARFAHDNLELVDGLVLWAAYPEESKDLSDSNLVTASIYGTRDGLATEDTIKSSRALMPDDTLWVAIDGGNHAQFGWYGAQSGDLEATISREEQQNQAIAATLDVLKEVQVNNAN